MKPKVSILIPVFNRAYFIAQCIQSALNQTLSDFEVVVVDNASSDGTWEICQKISKNDPRVKAFRNETNIGPVGNWKKCIELSSGEYCKILFSDDEIAPDCISKMIDAYDSERIGFVFSQVKIGTDKSTANISYSGIVDKSLNGYGYLQAAINNDAPLSPGAVLFKREGSLACMESGFPTSRAREYSRFGAGPDIVFLLNLLAGEKQAKYINEPLSFFRSHEDSFSIGAHREVVLDCYRGALAFYIKKHIGNAARVKYLAFEWARTIRWTKTIVNPFHFVKKYECDSTFVEGIQVLCMGIFLIFTKKAFGI